MGQRKGTYSAQVFRPVMLYIKHWVALRAGSQFHITT